MIKKSEEHEIYQTVPRPVGAMAKSYPAGYPGYLHSHPRAQLLYSESGTMKVTTGRGAWIVPPHRAVWFPPGCEHRTATLSAVEMRTLYVLPSACPVDAPREPCILRVSPLVRELIRRIVAMPIEYDEAGRDGRVISLLWEELNWSPIDSFSLPPVSDSRLLQIEEQLSANPGDNRTLQKWAASIGAAPRTLTRLLLRETGMSFRTWREQVRAFYSLPRLLEGTPVTVLAMEVGYETPSAFTAMFRRVMGTTPSEYLGEVRISSQAVAV
jgi:AraC-like DNA-binding protein